MLGVNAIWDGGFLSTYRQRVTEIHRAEMAVLESALAEEARFDSALAEKTRLKGLLAAEGGPSNSSPS